MDSSRQIGRALKILILGSLIIRAFFAAFLEFGNDEVYYWTYALFPDFSHFDHPPMVGYLIQYTSINLMLDSEFWIRLGSLIFGALNTYLIYMIGKSLKDPLTGFYAALLYTASIYAFVIAGIFILPDTPQLTFWMLTIYFLLNSITMEVSTKAAKNLLLAGVTTGLALLSKYTSVFLLSGVFLYLIMFNRQWFRTWQLYAAAVIALIFFLPVFIWNYSNDFISFTFQSDRVGIFEAGLRGDFFFTELGGQMLYNNPINFVLGAIAIIAFYRGKKILGKHEGHLLLMIALPLIFLFLFIALFRHTLPHWTGPAWTTIIILSAAYLREIGIRNKKDKLVPPLVSSSLGLLAIVLILGVSQVKGGMLFHDEGNRPENIGERDVSLDMYGWRQLSKEFTLILEEEKQKENIDPYSPFISSRWFPAANIDYYLASPHDIEVLGLGSMDALHKYIWITEERGGFSPGLDAWFLTVSRDFRDPLKMYGKYFEEVELAYTVPIYRNGKHVMNAFFYYLKDMKRVPNKTLNPKL